MWNATSKHFDDRTIKVAITLDGKPILYADVLQRWQTDATFRSFFINLLANSPFSAFRWETPPITTALDNRPFEFVLLNSPSLAQKVDTEAFAEHFNGESEGVVAFRNLGHDAILVVPCPVGSLLAYGHIGAFIRQASKAQNHALWSLVGEALELLVTQ